MKPSGLIYIVTCALLTAAANLLLRHGLLKSGGLAQPGQWLSGWIATLSQPSFLTGIILYGLAAIVWFYALSVTEVSTGYPVLVGLTFVLVALGAVGLFREPASPLKIAGIVTILAGILLLSRGS